MSGDLVGQCKQSALTYWIFVIRNCLNKDDKLRYNTNEHDPHTHTHSCALMYAVGHPGLV